MTTEKKQKNQYGFILMESLVGIIVVAIALIALMAMYIQATKVTTYNRNYNNAVYLAQETLEPLKQYEGKSEIGNQSYNDKEIIKDGVKYIVNLVNSSDRVSNSSLNTNQLYPYTAKISWQDSSVNPVIEHSIEVTAYYYGEN